MVGPDIYLHNVKSNFKISMVKTLVFRKIEIPQNQQSLYCMGLVMEDHKNLAFYNVDSDSNILIVRRLRGNASTLIKCNTFHFLECQNTQHHV